MKINHLLLFLAGSSFGKNWCFYPHHKKWCLPTPDFFLKDPTWCPMGHIPWVRALEWGAIVDIIDVSGLPSETWIGKIYPAMPTST